MSTSPEEKPVPEAEPFVPAAPVAEPVQEHAQSHSVPPAPVAPPNGYGYPQSPSDYSQQPSAAPYGAPTQQQSPYSQPYSAGQQQGYQQPAGYGQPSYGYDQQQGYQNTYPGYGQPFVSAGKKSATNSLTMGIIGVCLAFLIGWIPFFGLLGVGGGIGLGIPAILQAKRAEVEGENATAGRILGWVSIGIAVFWVVLYVFLFVLGSTVGHTAKSV